MLTQKLYSGIIEFLGGEVEAREFWELMGVMGVNLSNADVQKRVTENQQPLKHLMIRYKMGLLKDITTPVSVLKGT